MLGPITERVVLVLVFAGTLPETVADPAMALRQRRSLHTIG